MERSSITARKKGFNPVSMPGLLSLIRGQKMKGGFIMKQVVFNELGYFTESQIEAIKDELDMASYMSFNVSSSNCAGNRTLIVSTDYEADEEEIKNMFLHCALSSIYRLKNL